MRRLVLVLSGCAFVSLGLPDGLLGVAWPSIRVSFDRRLDSLGVLLVAGTAGYVTSSFLSGRLLRGVNLGGALAVSCAVTAVALLGYVAAGVWGVLPLLAVVLGLGGGAIDSALNTYAALRHGPIALNWLHACYGVGAALGPIIMTAVLSRGQSWRLGYAIVGFAQLSLSAAFAGTLNLWPRTTDAVPRGTSVAPDLLTTLSLPAARLAMLAFIVYAGVEATIGAWTYTLLTAGRGLPPPEAAAMVSVFWGGLTAGRVMAGLAGTTMPIAQLLRLALTGVVAGTLLIWMGTATLVTLAGVALAGVACGPIFPTLVAVTPGRLGADHTANAVGMQIAAAGLGLSVVPAVVGIAADTAGVTIIATLLVALALVLLLVCWRLERMSPAAPLERIVSPAE